MQWDTDDHLTRVANIQRTHIHKLTDANITTLADLAQTPDTITIPNLMPSALMHRYSLAPPGRLRIRILMGNSTTYLWMKPVKWPQPMSWLCPFQLATLF